MHVFYTMSASNETYNFSTADVVLGGKTYTIAGASAREWFGLGGDSLVSHCVVPVKMIKHPFVRQGMKSMEIAPRALKPATVDGTMFTGLIPFIIFGLVVITKVLYPRRFFQFITASFSNNAQWQLLREWYPLNNGLTYLYSLMYFAAYALLINGIAMSTGGSISIVGSWWLDLLLLFLIAAFIISGKYLTIMFLAVLFDARDSGERYLTTQITFALVSLLVMVPLLLVLYYQPGPISLVTSLIMLGLTQFLRIVRSLRVGLTEKSFGLLYLFLYLCALEIIPLLIVIKTFQIFANGGVIG